MSHGWKLLHYIELFTKQCKFYKALKKKNETTASLNDQFINTLEKLRSEYEKTTKEENVCRRIETLVFLVEKHIELLQQQQIYDKHTSNFIRKSCGISSTGNYEKALYEIIYMIRKDKSLKIDICRERKLSNESNSLLELLKEDLENNANKENRPSSLIELQRIITEKLILKTSEKPIAKEEEKESEEEKLESVVMKRFDNDERLTPLQKLEEYVTSAFLLREYRKIGSEPREIKNALKVSNGTLGGMCIGLLIGSGTVLLTLAGFVMGFYQTNSPAEYEFELKHAIENMTRLANQEAKKILTSTKESQNEALYEPAKLKRN